MVRSETGHILKAFIETNILDKNDVRTKMAFEYLQLKHCTNSL